MFPSPKRAGSVAYSLAMFALVSVLAGALVAGLFVPLAAAVGMGARAGASRMAALPADLATPAPPQRSRLLLADGTVLATFYDQNRVDVPLAAIAPVMRKAQIAIEDHRFYQHGAIDVIGTLRALVHDLGGGPVQGGSSLTQQYVKLERVEVAHEHGNSSAAKAARADTFARKFQELRYAIGLEHRFTKNQILDRYLNIAYYGDGAYGVEAAARHYFDTSAKNLTLPEAAMLAGLVQDPNNVNPVVNLPAALSRRNLVLTDMARWGMITPAQAHAAEQHAFQPSRIRVTRSGCVGTAYPFLCDYVRRDLLKNPALGATVQDRAHLLDRGGLTIRTEINPQVQDVAQQAISKVVSPKDPVISTIVMVQPGTGLIRAMAQSRPVMGSATSQGQTYYDYPVTPAMGGAEGFQAGSTFKAFTMAAALEQGIPMSRTYDAAKSMQYQGRQFTSCSGPFTLSQSYRVTNSTGVNGVMDMQKAINFSVNNYFVQLEQSAGLCNVVQMAKKTGVRLSTNRISWDQYSHYPSFTLGSAEVSPLSMAEAYATFAARGITCAPHIVHSITRPDGSTITAPSGHCHRVMPKAIADGVNQLLQGVMNHGTGMIDKVPGGGEQAGKTGTTNNSSAVWFMGYTPQLVAASMIAIDPTASYWQDHRRSLQNLTLPYSNTYLTGTGSGDPGRLIWKPVMTKALAQVPHTSFHAPPSVLVHGGSAANGQGPQPGSSPTAPPGGAG